MPEVQTLRDFVQQRLSVAAEEIFELFERTVAEYEETLCQQRKLLDAVFKPHIRLQRTGMNQTQCQDTCRSLQIKNFHQNNAQLWSVTILSKISSSGFENKEFIITSFDKDVQLLSVSQGEIHPEKQDWRPSLDQDDPPELPHIKEEEEEVLTSQEQEQLQGLEEVDTSKVTFTPVPVKSEEVYEERHRSSQLHYAQKTKTDGDGEDCGRPKPDKNFNPNSQIELVTDDEASHISQHETDRSFDLEETNGAQSGSNPLRNSEELEINTGRTPVPSSEYAPSFGHKKHPQEHIGMPTRLKPFSCSVCGKKYMYKSSVTAHMRLHSEEQRFSCSFCHKTFPYRSNLMIHMRIHTGEKPFSCSFCSAKFTLKGSLRVHMRIHTWEKPFSCSVCNAKFTQRSNMVTHLKIHQREKPSTCSVCGTTFTKKELLTKHMKIHTEEKPFICFLCGKRFSQFLTLSQHRCVGVNIGGKSSR